MRSPPDVGVCALRVTFTAARARTPHAPAGVACEAILGHARYIQMKITREQLAMASTSEKLELKIVGTRPIRPDGVDKVTGRANFGADSKMPGMLHGKIKRSPYPH